MKHAILALLLFAPDAFADAVKPLPNRDVITPGRPDWCGGYEPSGQLRLSLVKAEIDYHGFSHKGLTQMAQIACDKPADKEVQAAVASWRQQWINLTGLSAKHDRAQLALRVDPAAFDKGQHKFCAALQPSGEASPTEKVFAAAHGVAASCANRGDTPISIVADGTASEIGWWIDRKAEVASETARAVFVLRCLRSLRRNSDGSVDDWPDATNPWIMGAFAACGPDGRRLDEAAFEKEIAGAPWTDTARANARVTFALARSTMASLTDAYKAMAAKDAAYQRLLFDAPEAGWKAWEASYRANQGAFDAALAYEDKFYGPSKKALASCPAALRSAWTGYVAAKKPADLTQARAAATDAIGHVLLSSMALCDAVDGRFLLARAENELLNPANTPMRRGPRMAAYDAALAALNDVVSDRSKFAWQPNQFNAVVERPRDDLLSGIADRVANKTVYDNPVQGVLGTVAKTAAGYEVTFKAQKTTIPNRICTPNNRILSVHNGTVVYDSDCVIKGTVTLDETPKPLLVAPEVGAFLKVGQRVLFAIDQMDFKVRRGFPVEVWAGDKLVAYNGAPL